MPETDTLYVNYVSISKEYFFLQLARSNVSPESLSTNQKCLILLYFRPACGDRNRHVTACCVDVTLTRGLRAAEPRPKFVLKIFLADSPLLFCSNFNLCVLAGGEVRSSLCHRLLDPKPQIRFDLQRMSPAGKCRPPRL